MNFLAPQPLPQLVARAGNTIDIVEAELLMAHVLHRDRVFVLSHPEHHVPFFTAWRFWHLVKLRSKNLPIAYLLNHKEFWGLRFFVNKHTLIPRPETELLVEKTIAYIAQTISKTHILLIDIGTGSGCIPISVLHTLTHKNPGWTNKINTYASDISKQALRVAKKNNRIHSTIIHFLSGNLLQPILKILKKHHPLMVTTIITANLPYLTKQQRAKEPSIYHEPHRALVADKTDGLSLYQKLLNQLHHSPLAGQSFVILMEIDPDQKNKLINIAKKIFPTAPCTVFKDLSGLDRLVVLEQIINE